MTLKNQLSDKLKFIDDKFSKVKSAYDFTFQLVRNFLTIESVNDDLNRLFALKKSYLEKVEQQIELLVAKYSTIKKHKEIIPSNELSLQNILNILDEYADELSNIISDLQAISIILENRLKEK